MSSSSQPITSPGRFAIYFNILQAVVELLAKKASVRKAEVSEACKTLKLDFSDTQIAKQLREICISHGASWHLKESR